QGTYKLIDFGIAAADAGAVDGGPASARPAGAGETARVGVLLGTPGYIDPVCVATGAPADASSDLYALGALLFHALTGIAPDGATRGPLREALPEAPIALASLVDALRAPERRDRPAQASWVAVQLEQVRREVAGSVRVLPAESIGPFRGLGRFRGRDRDVY